MFLAEIIVSVRRAEMNTLRMHSPIDPEVSISEQLRAIAYAWTHGVITLRVGAASILRDEKKKKRDKRHASQTASVVPVEISHRIVPFYARSISRRLTR